MRYLRLVPLLLGVLTFLVIPSVNLHAQRGAYVAPRDIAALSQAAAVILRGHVIMARVEPHPQYNALMTVVVTLKPDEVLKGSTGKLYTFRQYIWDVRDRYDAAGYSKGQELLLLMHAVNENGLTSPAGLYQGRFRIERDQDGTARAVNGMGNLGLFKGVATKSSQAGAKLSAKAMRTATSHRQGPVPLEDLEEVIRSFAGGQQ